MIDLKVSVTDLESFRLFRTQEWMTFDKLMHSLLRTEPENMHMAAGTALHTFLQHAERRSYDDAEEGRFRFIFNMDEELVLSPLREMRASKVYDVGGVRLDVRGRVDGFDGTQVDDHKLKGKAVDAETYGDSAQWKLYLDILGGKAFNYNLFVATIKEKDEEAWWDLPCAEFIPNTSMHGSDTLLCTCGKWAEEHSTIEIKVRELYTLRLYSYPEMRADIQALLQDYVAFAQRYLTEEAIAEWKRSGNTDAARTEGAEQHGA